jgi:hypothetical protein
MNHHSSHPPPASDSGDQRPNDIDLDLALATNGALSTFSSRYSSYE